MSGSSGPNHIAFHDWRVSLKEGLSEQPIYDIVQGKGRVRNGPALFRNDQKLGRQFHPHLVLDPRLSFPTPELSRVIPDKIQQEVSFLPHTG
jgi:hypothetical protein